MIHASVGVRPAGEDDLGQINELYNHYVVGSHWDVAWYEKALGGAWPPGH